jgi:hypothetical protein
VLKANKIMLSSGREVWLCELNQGLTYEGHIEGLPTMEMNKSHLDSLVAEHQTRQPTTPFYLVPPVETPIDTPPGRTYPFGLPSRLPGVTCTGRFQSRSIGEHNPFYVSKLTIIWLQSEFAMPIEPSPLEEIAKLDWDALACNFEI